MSPLSTQASGRDERDDLILSKVVKAGRRTYFFDVQSTRGGDYYLSITESRKVTAPDGSTCYDRHKIHLYKEDFEKFSGGISEMLAYIRAAQPCDRCSGETTVE